MAPRLLVPARDAAAVAARDVDVDPGADAVVGPHAARRRLRRRARRQLAAAALFGFFCLKQDFSLSLAIIRRTVSTHISAPPLTSPERRAQVH